MVDLRSEDEKTVAMGILLDQNREVLLTIINERDIKVHDLQTQLEQTSKQCTADILAVQSTSEFEKAKILNSLSFRTGYAILHPLDFVRELLKRNYKN